MTGDRDALERMERVLDKANDPRLEQTLEYHAAASTSPAERAKLLKRLAKLATDRAGRRRARSSAGNRRCARRRRIPMRSPRCASSTSARERWPELAQILERLDGGRPLPAPGTPDAAMRVFDLERYALVLDQHLKDPARAVKAWHRVLELTPKSRTALEALARLYRDAGKWRELADILGRQVAVLVGSNFADDLDEGRARSRWSARRSSRSGSARRSMRSRCSTRCSRDINPNHLEAHTALRRLHEARGDFDAAVRIAEREMYLSPEPIRKVSRGLEIGFICRDRLGNPTRALQAFKRVLELDPEQDEAMAAAADLLAKLGRWKEHVAMLERMLRARSPASAAIPKRRWRSPTSAARSCSGSPRRPPTSSAIRRARSAGGGARTTKRPTSRRSPTCAAPARRTACGASSPRCITDERKRLIAAGGGVPAEPERFVALSRELAQLCERRLGDKPRAHRRSSPRRSPRRRATPSCSPSSSGSPPSSISARCGSTLLDAFELVLAAATPSERVELYLRRARILDERIGDPKGAVADVLAAFSWAPDRDDVRVALDSARREGARVERPRRGRLAR